MGKYVTDPPKGWFASYSLGNQIFIVAVAVPFVSSVVVPSIMVISDCVAGRC